MNSRYVYLPYLWPLMKPEIPETEFSASQLQASLAQALQEKDPYQKGILWENTCAEVLAHVPGWKIAGRRVRAGAQEIDISVVNLSLDDELWQLGAYILVECKNRRARADISQIRNIAHISEMKGNKTAILFAANGATADAREEIHRLVAKNIFILCITAKELSLIRSAKDCRALILQHWRGLQDDVEVGSIL